MHRGNDTEMTYDTDDSCFASNMLRSPCKVATIKTKCTVLHISSSHAYGVNTLSTELGGSWLSAELELSLLAIMGTLGTCLGAFVAR